MMPENGLSSIYPFHADLQKATAAERGIFPNMPQRIGLGLRSTAVRMSEPREQYESDWRDFLYPIPNGITITWIKELTTEV